MDFYAPLPPEVNTLQQGDLLADVPFTYFSVTNVKVTLASKRSAMRDLASNPTGVEFVAASVSFDWGMVLNQTCDVQPDPLTGAARKPILLARVRSIKTLFPKFKDSTHKESLGEVKNLATAGKSPTILYLPAHTTGNLSLPRSGADLLDVQRFSAIDLPSLIKLLRLQLQDEALQALQERCAYCFGRFGAPDTLYFSEQECAEDQRQRAERLRSQSR